MLTICAICYKIITSKGMEKRNPGDGGSWGRLVIRPFPAG